MQALALETGQDLAIRPDASQVEAAAPERTCVVTRQQRAPDELIRFVLGPDHAVVPDLKHKLPGRGVWVGLSRDLVAQAVKKQLFARGLKDKAIAAPDLPGLIETLLTRDAMQGLALANKAGLATTGFAKVESVIASGKIAALIHARDGAEDGKRKMRQALRRRFGEHMPPEFEILTTEEMDSALGRGNVVHAAIGTGAAAKVFLASARRLALYRGDGEAEGPGRGRDLTVDVALQHDCEADGANAEAPGTHERYE
jgi:uncharacterized protein